MATDKVDKYFNCKETKYATCCTSCHYAPCNLDCVSGKNCKDGTGSFDITCPKREFVDEGFSSETMINATFSFKG